MIRLLGDKIAVIPCSPQGMVGGIHIPDITKSTKNQTFHYAKVVAHGIKAVLAITGKTVLVSEYAGDEVEVDGQKVFIMRERHIVGVVET